MKKLLLSFGLITLVGTSVLFAQSSEKITDSTLQITGSGDVYYRYNLAQSSQNVPTQDALGTKQNSVDFGMLDLKVKKEIGKTTVFSELAFGPRASSTIDNAVLAYYIQNLYLSYQAMKKLSFSAGIMYHYDTYEKLNAAENFHYSVSNAFIESRKVPSRSVGIKANYAFSDKVNLMVGLFNSIDASNINNTDAVTSTPGYGMSDVVAQLVVKPIKDLKLSAAIWNEGQKAKGIHANFQASYQLKHGIKLGLDINNYAGSDSAAEVANGYNNFTSYAFYAQKAVCPGFTVGLRYENESIQQNAISGSFVKENYNIITLTGREKLGPLYFKQEVKYDMTDNSNINSPYLDKDGKQTSKDVQLVLAAVFTF